MREKQVPYILDCYDAPEQFQVDRAQEKARQLKNMVLGYIRVKFGTVGLKHLLEDSSFEHDVIAEALVMYSAGYQDSASNSVDKSIKQSSEITMNMFVAMLTPAKSHEEAKMRILAAGAGVPQSVVSRQFSVRGEE